LLKPPNCKGFGSKELEKTGEGGERKGPIIGKPKRERGKSMKRLTVSSYATRVNVGLILEGDKKQRENQKS